MQTIASFWDARRSIERDSLLHARALMLAGSLDDAIAAYEAIRAGNPRHREALLQLGRLYVRQGLDSEAEPVLRALLRRKRGHAEALLLLSRLLLRRRQHGEARTILRRLVRVRPKHREGLLKLSRLYADGEDWRRAIPTLRRFLAVQPDHEEARALLERMLRCKVPLHRRLYLWLSHRAVRRRAELQQHLQHARTYLNAGEREAAIAALEAAYAIDPQHVEVLLELGRLYCETGRHAAARPLLQSYLEQVPHHLDARLLLARIAMELGSAAELEEGIAALLAINPVHREGLTMQAELETRRGHHAAATEAWARAWHDDAESERGAERFAPISLAADLSSEAVLDQVALVAVNQRIATIGRYYTGTYDYYDLLLRCGSLIQNYERQVVHYLLEVLDPRCPIVEVGSGFGLLVMLLGLHGRRAVGVEYDPRRAATFAAILDAAGPRLPAIAANSRVVCGAFPFGEALPIPPRAGLVFTNVAAGVEEAELRRNIRALTAHPFVLFDAERFFSKRESDAEIEWLLGLFADEGLPAPQPAFQLPDRGGSYYLLRPKGIAAGAGGGARFPSRPVPLI